LTKVCRTTDEERMKPAESDLRLQHNEDETRPGEQEERAQFPNCEEIIDLSRLLDPNDIRRKYDSNEYTLQQYLTRRTQIRKKGEKVLGKGYRKDCKREPLSQ
jgi:hypothetical protein